MLDLIPRKCVYADRMYAVENALFNIRVVPLQAAYKRLYFLTLRASSAVVTHRAVLGEAAGTLYKLEVVIALPR